MVVAEDSSNFDYNFNYVPAAATIVYSVGFGLPLGLKLVMKFFGTGFFSSSYLEVFKQFLNLIFYRWWEYMGIHSQAL